MVGCSRQKQFEVKLPSWREAGMKGRKRTQSSSGPADFRLGSEGKTGELHLGVHMALQELPLLYPWDPQIPPQNSKLTPTSKCLFLNFCLDILLPAKFSLAFVSESACPIAFNR